MTAPFELDPMIAWLLRLALACVFAQAALHKARDFASAVQIIADYKVTPVEWAHFHALGALLAEGFVAIGLLISGFATVAPGAEAGVVLARIGVLSAVAIVGLLAVYSAAIGVNLARGRREIDCGCMGPAGKSPRIGPWLLVRNAVLALAATALAALPVSARTLHWIDALSLAGGFAVLVLVWFAVHLIAATAPLVESGESS